MIPHFDTVAMMFKRCFVRLTFDLIAIAFSVMLTIAYDQRQQPLTIQVELNSAFLDYEYVSFRIKLPPTHKQAQSSGIATMQEQITLSNRTAQQNCTARRRRSPFANKHVQRSARPQYN